MKLKDFFNVCPHNKGWEKVKTIEEDDKYIEIQRCKMCGAIRKQVVDL